MDFDADAGGMELILITLVLAALLAPLLGADSRVDERRRADWRRS